MPCTDVENDVISSTVSVHADANSSSDRHVDDNCSPFCACNCCHFNAFCKSNEYTKNALSLKIVVEKPSIEYTSELFSNFQNSIWQPPQIS
jgi:hypothetical protein